MSSKHLLGDTNYAWPTAEIAVMGAKVKTWRRTFLGWGPLLIKSCVAGKEPRSGVEGSLLPRQSSPCPPTASTWVTSGQRKEPRDRGASQLNLPVGGRSALGVPKATLLLPLEANLYFCPG